LTDGSSFFGVIFLGRRRGERGREVKRESRRTLERGCLHGRGNAENEDAYYVNAQKPTIRQ
jgi:hypothetical protein